MVRLGASVTFDGDECKITRNSKLLAVGETRGKLYVLKVIHEKEDVNIAKEESNLNLWHCRFGHPGMGNISKLIDGNMVDGMKTTKDTITETCESCVMGKQHRTAYPKEIPYRAVEPFEIVHSVVSGPMHVNSFGNLRYYVTFIDDYSRYTHVYFIKRKSEVLDKFKEFVSYATNTTERKSKFYVPIMTGNIVRWPFKNT